MNNYKVKPILSVLFILFVFTNRVTAQEQKINLSESYNNLAWPEFVKKVEQNHKYRFYYRKDSLPDFKVILPKGISNLEVLLDSILNPYNYFAAVSDKNVFITKNKKIQTQLPSSFFSNKERNIIRNTDFTDDNSDNYLKIDELFVKKEVTVGSKAQNGKPFATLFGYVRSRSDNSPIIGGFVQVVETGEAVNTNDLGFYTFKLKPGKYTLKAGSLESKEELVKVNLLSDGRLDLKLRVKPVALDEVIVNSDKEHIVSNTKMGYQKFEAKKVKEIPLVLGERDIVKISLLLPGIQSVGEGSSGFNVRGSPTDQNLFLINHIPVYNSSHLLGFFSAFNSDAVKDFSLYKSNIPINYGGRLASIFDVDIKQGNKTAFKANGGISPVTSRIMAEGPIVKEKSSYLVSVRSTYSDWVLKRVENPDIKNSDAQFADLVTNFSFDLNANNQINFFTYHSYDRINLISKNKYNYTNNGSSLSWRSLIKDKHKLETALVYSRYDFSEENTESAFAAYADNFTLNHTQIKSQLTLRPGTKHNIIAGVSSSLYHINNGTFQPFGESSLLAAFNPGKEKALESGVFLSDEWALSPVITLVGGIRFNNYLYLGENHVRNYPDNLSRNIGNLTDSAYFGKNEIIESYSAPDFRFASRIMINENYSVKLSYNQLRQYLFLMSNTIAVSPTDKWKLADNNLKPMKGQQFSIGLYNSRNKYNISVEAYYKLTENFIEYKNGANLIVNQYPETDILQGDMNSYGVEFMIKKSRGRFNGWFNYTYSRAFVKMDSEHTEEIINGGDWFNSNYDKPHAANLVMNYRFSRRFSVSTNLVYSTGRPVTYPVGAYEINDTYYPIYSERNEYRIPDYFRMDLSVKVEGNLASRKLAHGTWIFSIYNLTGRKNAYSVYFKTEKGQMNAYKLSIFGTPIVSLTYSFKLGNYAN